MFMFSISFIGLWIQCDHFITVISELWKKETIRLMGGDLGYG
jgi:hypothetical protein